MAHGVLKQNVLTPTELAHLGEGSLAYLREIDSGDLKGKFPGIVDIQPGIRLWALFAANGQPILLSDVREKAIAQALQNDLTPVVTH
ncbi:DUF1150 family protein [Limoniibacter endophyticus]|uniref:DUF1150 family protein n=1 Tax=Limoniibacter endophyticus TaxID=1565040 RepID=A0A8J3GGM7_9HYPH|nr:DUF1150 family protein [Limoniibacter endophyticus]GHC66570.1 hypothetical protein GCM10010136_09770 [Limoniibacter endophyticus]